MGTSLLIRNSIYSVDCSGRVEDVLCLHRAGSASLSLP